LNGPAGSNNFKKLQAQLRAAVGKAIGDYAMIEDGDRVMVCLSGGKDSYTLLDMLQSLQRNAPIRFDLLAVNLDQKQPGFPAEVLPRYLRACGVPFRIIEQDTYSVVKRVIPSGKTLCGLCSRLRRGALYRFAAENGITKIALGHHRDDIVETLFLNLFFGGRLKAMPPKLLSEDRRHIVIRPLAYVAERDVTRYAAARGFPLIPCTLCGSQPNLQRLAVKRMLAGWEAEHPGRIETIFASLRHVAPSQLADRELFDFAGLEALRDPMGPEPRAADSAERHPADGPEPHTVDSAERRASDGPEPHAADSAGRASDGPEPHAADSPERHAAEDDAEPAEALARGN
jgi:tRNA 2-thiocytidine biosynthesis protein TtcA